MNIGVLALQGGVEEHINHIKLLGHTYTLVKKVEDLENIDGIILPGGESTAIGKLLKITGLLDSLREKILNGLPSWGTCAGMILLAKDIIDEPSCHLNVLDISVVRNAYGSQIDSFNTYEIIEDISDKEIELIFIRAPYIIKCANSVTPLCFVNENIVAAKYNNILVTSFHPELTNDTTVLNYFINNFIVTKKDYHN